MYNTDLLEFVTGDQELNINAFCLTEEKENVYRFLNLAYTNLIEPKAYETQAYINNTLEKREKQIYLCPYINEYV